MKRILLFIIVSLSLSVPAYADQSILVALNFSSFWDFSCYDFMGCGSTTTTPPATTYYLLTAGTNDNITTPTGDKITIVH